MPTTGWVNVTFLTAECGLFASNDIFEKILRHPEKYSIQVKCTLISATVDLLFKNAGAALAHLNWHENGLFSKKPQISRETDN